MTIDGIISPMISRREKWSVIIEMIMKFRRLVNCDFDAVFNFSDCYEPFTPPMRKVHARASPALPAGPCASVAVNSARPGVSSGLERLGEMVETALEFTVQVRSSDNQDVVNVVACQGRECRCEWPIYVGIIDGSATARTVKSRAATIRVAEELMAAESPERGEIIAMHERLSRNLSAHDTFWPGWVYFAEDHGVEV